MGQNAIAAQTFGGFALNDGLYANFRNLLDGGDFTTNPWQRDIAGLATSHVITTPIAGTVTYFPDRWFAVGGASSAIQLSKVINDTNVAGFNVSCKFQRQSGNANLAVLNFGQVVESADSYRMQGQPVALSFWARTGANYSGGALTVQIFTGTGKDDTAANMVAGTWASSATPLNTTQALTGTMTRYTFNCLIPAGTSQVGVLLSWTPTGTAGADDSIILNGLQLEIGQYSTPFEHRDAQVELEICQRYAWAIPEPASGVVVGSGLNNGTNTQLIYMAAPVQFYKAPTVTVAAGTFKTNQGGVATACTITAGTTHTPNAISINGNSTGTSGQGTLLQGGGGSGYILASADY